MKNFFFFKTTLIILLVSPFAGFAHGWSLTGNTGTTNSNFIGTIDGADFRIRTNNSIRINVSGVDGKVAIGNFTPSFALDVKGGINTDDLYRLGKKGVLSVKGSQNAFVGINSGFNNTTGVSNTANGHQALYSNTVGSYNTALGYNTLYSNVAGSNATAIGINAMRYANNSSNALTNDNVAVGFEALRGSVNPANNKWSGNTAVGYQALRNMATGSFNIAVGEHALLNTTSGVANIAIGFKAFSEMTGVGATGNIAVGYRAGGTITTTGENLTLIGYLANASNSISNSTALGANASVVSSNHVRIGNEVIESIGGQVNWTATSDGRFKKNIQANVPGLEFIKRLRPVTYTLDIHGLNNFFRKDMPVKTNPDGKIIEYPKEDEDGIAVKEKIIYSGFIAQDVEQAAKEVSYDFSGVDAPKNNKDVYGLRYAEFVVPLVKAVQELSKMNDEKDLQLTAQKKINADLQKQIDKLRAMIVSRQSAGNSEQSVVSSASLSQNIPNPFNNTTMINYYLPKQFSEAKIIILIKMEAC